METALRASSSQSATPKRSLAADIGASIALAFGFSWIMTIGAIKLGLAEEYLNIGTAGPAVAALLLSRHRQPGPVLPSGSRWLWFGVLRHGVLLALSWIVLSVHYLWWHDIGAPVHVNPWLLLPALVPAWILSGIFSANEGERSLVRRLVHAPDRWSIYALLYLFCWASPRELRMLWELA